MEEKENVLSEALFNQIKKDCPAFLQSYFVLSKFYEHMTNDFNHKVWKDGRIVLTPKPKENVED